MYAAEIYKVAYLTKSSLSLLYISLQMLNVALLSQGNPIKF